MPRRCKGCNKCIEYKHPNAKFCKTKCKDRYWNLANPRGYGAPYSDNNPCGYDIDEEDGGFDNTSCQNE